MSNIVEQYEEIVDIDLRKALDKGIDDMEAGRELPLKEAMRRLTEMRESRRNAGV